MYLIKALRSNYFVNIKLFKNNINISFDDNIYE